MLVALAALIGLFTRLITKKIEELDLKNTDQHKDNRMVAQEVATAAKAAADIGESSYSLMQSIDTRLHGITEIQAKMHEDIGGIRQWQTDHTAMHARLEQQ